MDNECVLNGFHPSIKRWFTESVGNPSLPQIFGWPEIQAGKNVLISAPTGAGKTLAAFLESIDRLLKMSIESSLPDGVFILYISPLKALNNDIYKNLDIPLEGIKKICSESGVVFPEIIKAVRTGDTPQNERQKMLKNPPHILITTPESLYLMLTSKKAADILKNVRYLIVDEIHTMLGTKRGVHLALSLERLQHITERELVRIGLSATVNPIEAAASYLGGFKFTGKTFEKRSVTIVAPQMTRSKDLMIHMPVSDFRALEDGTIWPDIYENIFKLINQHASTIVFVNNRAVAERVAANINSIADNELCRPHHGCLSKNKRLEVEERFKSGDLKCIIATSTLELGIDIGSVDLMIQVASPLSVASGLQRLGRAGHRLNATSKGRIIPKTRGDLLKCVFISQQMLEGTIEHEKIPTNCLDILSQHIVSMCCQGRWLEDEMLSVIKSVFSYKDLKETDFKRVLAMLAGDFEHMEDIPARPRIYWDRQNRTIEGTGYSRMLAVNSSGTIPDRGYFSVVLEDHKTRIGELDEVFVFEARIGDRFMLGNSAWKIVKIEKNRVIVSQGSAFGAKIPFWNGDGIGSPYEQGILFGRFLNELSDKLESEDFLSYLSSTVFMDDTAAMNVRNFLLDQKEVIGCLSNDKRIIVEYLKDENSDQKIMVHAHFGGRVNSVLAILLQKALEDTIRCQAHASSNNDSILIHVYGCPDSIQNIMSLLSPLNVENTLITMLPATSRFAMAFRYNAYRSLMMGVRNIGQRLPLWVQRLRSVDALENAQKFMDHPLIIETMRECLEETFDIPNTINVLNEIRSGTIEVLEKNTWFPSPFASELLFDFKSLMMYAEKQPHPADRESPVISCVDALNLSYHMEENQEPLNIEAVTDAATKNSSSHKLKDISSSNELHSFLLIYGDILSNEISADSLQAYMAELTEQSKALSVSTSDSVLYIACEEWELYSCALESDIAAQSPNPGTWSKDDAISRIIRRYARYHSPFTLSDIIVRYDFIHAEKIRQVLNLLRSNGFLKCALFTDRKELEFCHNKVYEAIIRKSNALKSDGIAAKDLSCYASFLPVWQKAGSETTSPETFLYEVIRQLEGLFLPGDLWENVIFPSRIKGYSSSFLDKLCSSGRVFWRVDDKNTDKNISIAWYCIEDVKLGTESINTFNNLSSFEEKVISILRQKGACFTHILSAHSGINPSELLDILENLFNKGIVVNDSFAPIRLFLQKKPGSNSFSAAEKLISSQADGTAGYGMHNRSTNVKNAKRIASAVSRPDMGRWEIAWPVIEDDIQALIERWFKRYGLLSRDTLSQEKTSFTWNEIYEALKVREYSGSILRGYFIKGISGIQFMLPDAWSKLSLPSQMQVLNACDTAQPYGKIIPRSEDQLPFTNIPGTCVIIDAGKPVVVLERYGERVLFSCKKNELTNALLAFKDAYKNKRIWPERKKITVKNMPEASEERELLRESLINAGFKNDILKYVLWRQ